MRSFSAVHRARRPEACSRASESSFSRASSRAFASFVFSFWSARFSISRLTIRRSTASISTGTESIWVRRRAPASSIRSIALSGRNRSGM